MSNRRAFLKNTALVGTGVWLGTASTKLHAAEAPNDKLNVAVIGCGGQGRSNLNGMTSQNIVALCDIDEQRAGDAFEKFPKAKHFQDYRVMFDKMANDIDCVMVSTPDHTHFHPSMIAMDLGKHLYCEKPMAHSIDQVRRMTKTASENKLATQLGVQRHTIGNVHRVVELIKSGAIGKVTEVHSWVGGDRGMPDIPKETPPVPPTLNWDLWLGQAQERPYHKSIAPYGWRFWWDYGTGETGNWGCHILDIPFWALDLTYPNRVDASGPEPHPLTTPKQMTVKYTFPEDRQRDRPAIDLHWYHSKPGPDVLDQNALPHFGSGSLFVGSQGMLLTDFSKHRLFPEDKFKDFQRPKAWIPDSPGFHQEFINACKGGESATCNFDYSGPLAETVLLGNVAYRAGGFDWDAANLKASGNPNADQYLNAYVRKGWEI